MVGRVSTFQPGGDPVLIPGGVRDFNLYHGSGRVICVLTCVVSGGGPEILLPRDSERPALMLYSSVQVNSLTPPIGI